MSRGCVQLAILVTVLTGIWIFLFKDELSERVHYLMGGMLLVFLRLLYKTAGNPGVVISTTGKDDPHGYGIEGTNYCEQCGATHSARTYCSPGTKRCITRFDHHNPLLKIDVGLCNHVSYYSMLAWSVLWCFLIWYFTLNVFYSQHDTSVFLFSYVPRIPLLKEFCCMVYMMIEAWVRFTFFLYTLGCLPIRYGYYQNKDVPWFMTTADDTETQFMWGIYYVPMALSIVAAWYTMAGLSVFITHAVILAGSNMTIEEEVRATAMAAIAETRWRQFSSILFGIWTEVVAVMTTHRLYRFLHVYDGEDPTGYAILNTSNGLRDAFGTIPTHLSKYDQGSFSSNIWEIWSKKRTNKPQGNTLA